MLEIPFFLEEIKEAIWLSESDKSHGADGFIMGFFKAYLNTIKDDLITFVNKFNVSDKLPKAITASFLTLIPKKGEPSRGI